MRKFHTGYTLDDGVTNSMLQDYYACRQLVEHHLQGWETKQQKSSLRFGSMVHKALQRLYEAIAKGAVGNLEVVIRKAIDAELKKNLKLASDAFAAAAMEMEAAKAEAVLMEYLMHWGVDLKREWVAVEPVFDVVFRGHRIRGRMDGMYAERKQLRPLETKTKSRISEDSLTAALNFDFQCLMYRVALRCQGLTPLGPTLYNIIRTPQHKQGKKEDQAGFIARLRGLIQKDPDHFFHRYELPFSKADEAAFEDELEIKLNEWAAWVRGDIPTIKVERTCIGMWTCEFLGMCASGCAAGYSQTRKLFRELEDDDGGSEKGDGKKEAKGRKRQVKRRRKV